ncbi:SubName: Full=Uncharacterized protein {ECO:0000313/EMBL:CCA75402.1} [Serendipita indica DSM 11827]|uniref:Methyltransferase domain-containing protein n=1 Tax=Serendipita indica (strain DSM 11827) TaxID=1109443 RepID=G4TVQ9_SERID|nr:SubName: Full=Uncharacterized protein {ECO:0000313/EMBL:CCA75402.1} [Serendipita indica DSM 11827]CCA75402.1 hypothetical protein PIIN_09385 [Serendipita indica DSM 11827]
MAEELTNEVRMWTVREPYHILCSDDEGETVDENGAPVRAKRKIRPTRRVPAYFQNFLRECDRPGMHGSSASSTTQTSTPSTSGGTEYPKKTRLFNTQNMEYFLPSGCGNGAWLVDMAYEFPHVDFLGVDLIPCPAADAPSNVSFEIDDINHGLEHFAGKFDLVHARMISFGIKNYRKTMEEISRCVKPGGLVILMEADMELLGVDRMTVLPMALTEREMLDARAEARISGPIPGLSNDDEDETSGVEMRGSWLQRLLYEMRYATRLNGSDFTCAEDAVDEGLWRMHIFDPDTCGASSLYIPITPWPQMRDQALSQQLKYAGSLMRQDIYNALRATQPLFRKHGVSQAVIDQWVAAADYDLMAETFRAWVRFRIAWGRRRSSTSLSNSPPLASFPQDEKEKDTVPNHQVEVYQTLQESMIAKALRMSSRVSKPIPFLAQLAQGKNISL